MAIDLRISTPRTRSHGGGSHGHRVDADEMSQRLSKGTVTSFYMQYGDAIIDFRGVAHLRIRHNEKEGVVTISFESLSRY